MCNEEKRNARARIKLGNVEVEFEGREKFVQQNVDDYFEPAASVANHLQSADPETIVVNSLPKQMPLEMASSASDTRQDEDALNIEYRSVKQKRNIEVPKDFPTFYRKKNPKSQWQAVLVITYYYQNYDGYEYLTYKDFDEAYLRLEQIGVDEPGNIRVATKEACEQKLLFRPERKRGKFALTVQGSEFVEKMTGLDTDSVAS